MPKRRTFRRRLGVAKKALKMVRKLKRVMKPELKMKAELVTTTFDSVGKIQDVPRIAEGAGQASRTGLQIRMLDLEFRAQINRNASAATTFCRMVFFMDRRQVSDSKTSVADVLELVNSASGINNLNRKRYKILRNKHFFLTANQDARVFSFRVRLKVVQGYNGALLTDIEKNGVYLLLLSNQPTNVPTIVYFLRMRYTDV